MQAIRTIPLEVNGHAVKSLSLINPADWIKAMVGAGVSDQITMAEAFKYVGWFRSAAETRANAVVATPWEITRINAGPKDPPVWASSEAAPKELAFIRNFQDVLYLTELSCLMDAGAWFLKVGENRVEALQYFAPSTIDPKEGGAGTTGWIRRVDGYPNKTYDLDEVIHVRIPNPFQEQAVKSDQRMGEARAALAAATVLFRIDNFSNADLKRGLLKPTLVRVPKMTPEKEKRRLSQWLKDKFTNSGNTDRPDQFGIVEADTVEIETMAANLTDLAAEELVQINRQAIANAFRVPSSMLESREAANRSVSEQDVRSFYSGVVIPREKVIASAFNEQLLNPLGYQLTFHAERLEAFQAAELEKSDKVALLFESGLVTRNEAREPIDGLDPIEGEDGDAFFEAPPALTLNTERASRVRKAVTQLRKAV